MSSIPPIPPPTGEMPQSMKRVDESIASKRLNLMCFLLALVACLVNPHQISLVIGSFWPILIVTALVLPLFVPSSRLRRGRQVYMSIIVGVSIGCYLAVRQHYDEFVAINDSIH